MFTLSAAKIANTAKENATKYSSFASQKVSYAKIIENMQSIFEFLISFGLFYNFYSFLVLYNL